MNDTQIYDMAVIGGGIAGAGAARDAAARGLGVVLFEKNEFGSGTSSKSSKLIHGGIRYLELSWNALKRLRLREAGKNLKFVFFSLKESRILQKTAPALIRPIELIVPVYASDKRKPFTVYIGAYVYFFLARFSGPAKRPRIFTAKETAESILPGLTRENLEGSVMVHDHFTDDKALVEAVVRSAKKNGAVCLEKTPVTGYIFEAREKIYKIRASTNGGEKIFLAKKIIDATGPWMDQKIMLPVAGAHITVKKFLDRSALLQAEDERIFFVINIGNTARVGTTEWICREPDTVQARETDENYLLKSLNRYFPEKKFTREDILSRDAGIRPLALSDDANDPHRISREHDLRIGPDGALHLIGVKLTDHRRAAEKAVDSLFPGTKSRTANQQL